jgi:hypothetical protein
MAAVGFPSSTMRLGGQKGAGAPSGQGPSSDSANACATNAF